MVSYPVGPHFDHGMQACSPNLVADIVHPEQIHRLPISLVTGMRHLPYEERLQRPGLRADLITTFKIFLGLLDFEPDFPPSRSMRPTRAPLQGTPRGEPPPKERVGIFGEGSEILE